MNDSLKNIDYSPHERECPSSGFESDGQTCRPACDHHNLNIDRTENINKQIDTRKLFQTVLPKDLTFIFSFQVRLINCILQGIYEFMTFLSNYHNNNLYKD